jgi:hypothetical protein
VGNGHGQGNGNFTEAETVAPDKSLRAIKVLIWYAGEHESQSTTTK